MFLRYNPIIILHTINDSRIRLQTHTTLQPVMKHTSNKRAVQKYQRKKKVKKGK